MNWEDVKNMLLSAKSDYAQLFEKDRPIAQDANLLMQKLSRNVPSNADFRNPQAMSQWAQVAALNAPMMGVVGKLPPTKFSRAHDLAQKNAALPIEQGGLGLPPNNTAMDRARAMGFDTDTNFYHATNGDFSEFIPGNYRGASYFSGDPKKAVQGARAGNGDNVSVKNINSIIPVFLRGKAHGKDFFDKSILPDIKTAGELENYLKNKTLPDSGVEIGLNQNQKTALKKMQYQHAKEGGYIESIPENEFKNYPGVIDENGFIQNNPLLPIKRSGKVKGDAMPYKDFEGVDYNPWEYQPDMTQTEKRGLLRHLGFDSALIEDEAGYSTAVMNPKVIRSRFAAFDPMQKDSANILASILLGTSLAGGLYNDE